MSVRLAAALAVLVLGLPGASSAQTILQQYVGEPDVFFGHDVDGGGDVDGDGVPDLLVAEAGTSLGPETVHVFAGTGGAELYAIPVAGSNGTSVAFVGDLDGDGHDEFAIGQAASAHVAVHDGATGAVLFDDDGPSYFGGHVAAAGDVDGDGVPDVIVGSRADGLLDVGGDTVRVLSGATGATLHELSFFDPFDFPMGFGWSVAGLGDVDGDGLADVAIGVPLVAPGGVFQAGRVELRSGADFALLSATPGAQVGEWLGATLAPVGDVDGDGVPDVAAGTRGHVGLVKLLSGADGSLIAAHPVVDSDVHNPIDVDGVPDLDGDGVDDLACGVPGALRVVSAATGAVLFEVTGFGDPDGSPKLVGGELGSISPHPQSGSTNWDSNSSISAPERVFRGQDRLRGCDRSTCSCQPSAPS